MSNNVHQKIRSSRKEAKLTQTDLANLLKVELQTVFRWENGKVKKISIDTLEQIAKATGKPLSYFLNQESSFEIKNFTEAQMPVKKIPLISWVAANRFGEASDPFPLGVAEEWGYTTIKGENVYQLKVKGDCMETEFKDGDIITINPHVTPKNGQFVVVRDNHADEATFKQYKEYSDGKIVLHPLNSKYEDIELNKKNGNRYHIAGVVAEKVKKY